jgi:hypothetical protein
LNTVNARLLTTHNIDFKRQRLDPVEINGDMAKLSRIQLFHRTVKGLLKDLRRNAKEHFAALDPAMANKHLSDDKSDSGSSCQIFGGGKPGESEATLKGMAADMPDLIETLKEQPRITAKLAFKNLQRLFSEQCVAARSENAGGGPELPVQAGLKEPKAVPGSSLQNPSDPDAAYSGHKGQGCHVQLMETCGAASDEEVKTINLITWVHVEGADVHDGKSTIPAIEAADRTEARPAAVLADASYGSGANCEKAKKLGVELISPVGGKDPEAGETRLAEFDYKDGVMLACPEGQKPWVANTTGSGKTTAAFDKKICGGCPRPGSCPVGLSGGKAQVSYCQKELRLSLRRARERTEEFKKLYAMRSGIEATNSRLACETRLKKLRYR